MQKALLDRTETLTQRYLQESPDSGGSDQWVYKQIIVSYSCVYAIMDGLWTWFSEGDKEKYLFSLITPKPCD